MIMVLFPPIVLHLTITSTHFDIGLEVQIPSGTIVQLQLAKNGGTQKVNYYIAVSATTITLPISADLKLFTTDYVCVQMWFSGIGPMVVNPANSPSHGWFNGHRILLICYFLSFYKMNKKIQLIFALMLLVCGYSIAGVPQGINYQAVARDNNGSVLVGTDIEITFTIINGLSATVFFGKTQQNHQPVRLI